jgi:hypothetical protein
VGQALSWIAVKALPEAELAKALRLRKTGKQSDATGAALVGRPLEDGWYLVIANRADDRITQRKTLKLLSRSCQAIACCIEEHVMFSSCALWRNGRQVWSVRHRGDRSSLDLVEAGRLPAEYAASRDHFIGKQKAAGRQEADVDYVFELPLQLAKQFVGFQHDEETPGATYEILEPFYSEKIRRAISALIPWLYAAAILIGVIVLLAFVAVVGRTSLQWLFQKLQRFLA